MKGQPRYHHIFLAAVLCVACNVISESPRRIAYSGNSPGIFIAIDSDGAEALRDANHSPNTIKSEHLVYVANGTKILSLGRAIFRLGKFVTPYSASLKQLAEDGAIEVEKVKVLDGDMRGTMGWAFSGSLRADQPPPF